MAVNIAQLIKSVDKFQWHYVIRVYSDEEFVSQFNRKEELTLRHVDFDGLRKEFACKVHACEYALLCIKDAASGTIIVYNRKHTKHEHATAEREEEEEEEEEEEVEVEEIEVISDKSYPLYRQF